MKKAALPASGWLIVGHGTRERAGQDEFRDVVRQLAQRTKVPVSGAFLELAEPTIAQGLDDLTVQGVRRVVVVPLLLFAAGHAKEDVPAAVAQAAKPLGIEVVGQSAPLELHPKLLELSRVRFQEAAGDQVDPAETLLLMVGRGGSDETAVAAMRLYAAVLSATLGVQFQTAFVALAAPSVETSLSKIAGQGFRQVVVQPHLLFSGEVLHFLRRQVTLAAETHSHIKWVLASPLGTHPLLVEAIYGRIGEVTDLPAMDVEP